MNCDKHPETIATYWRKGLAKGNDRIYMCQSCLVNTSSLGLVVHSLEPPSEHCEVCGTRTGGGRCTFCDDLRDKELST